ncbi:unnamed protein product [Arabidopsis arenosa]|uniref:Ubiquitin-like protease family profile domain-containing protein n=1 Tax=Arabidopsis arenosa TaxID=38785 RepID=A0A8S2AL54_ARAAE|nr:unnamed protein product [Arabidopsis arenosa]
MTKKKAVKSKIQSPAVSIKQEPSRRSKKSDFEKGTVSGAVKSAAKSPSKSPTTMYEEPTRRGIKRENKRGNRNDPKQGDERGIAHSPAKTTTGEYEVPNPSLPCRLLHPDDLPDRVRLNIYSKPEYLGILVELLEGSEAWDLLLASQFKKLFELPVASNKKQHRVTDTFVEMLHNVEFFMSYPWGRVAFEATMERFGPLANEKDPVAELKARLQQKSSCCYGFPLALQLQVLNSIPALCSRIKDPADFRNFIQRPAADLGRIILLRESDVVDAEYTANLSVEYTLYQSTPVKDDLSWPNEDVDPGVQLIISLIKQKHQFKPETWPVHGLTRSPTETPGEKEAEPREAPSATGEEFGGDPINTRGKEYVDLESDGPKNDDTCEPRAAAKRAKKENYTLGRKPFTRSSRLAEELVDSQPPSKKASSHKRKDQPQPSAAAIPVGQSGPKKTGKKAPTQGDAAQPGAGSSSSQFVTHAELSDLKSWISQQLVELRSNIGEDILKNLGNKSQGSKPRQPHTEKAKSKRKKKKEEPASRKRKREAVISLSPGSSSSGSKQGLSGDIPIGKEGGPTMNFEACERTWDLYGAAKTIAKEIRPDSPDYTIPDPTTGEPEKEPVEEEISAREAEQTPPTTVTPFAEHVIPETHEASPNTDCAANETQKETSDKEFFEGSPKQTPSTPVTPFAQIIHETPEASAQDDCKYRNLSSIVAASPAYFVIESTNPRQPLPGKRVPRRSRFLDSAEYSVDPRISALFKSRTKEPAYTPLPKLEDGEFEKFKELLGDDVDRLYTICTGHKLSNGHFLDIATKEKWITTEHMQLITGMLLRRRGKAYSLRRVAIIDTWFTSLLSTHHDDFMKCEDKENYEWGSSIKAYVTGKSTGIHMKSEFLKHVDVVYVPMNWGCYHWVGLVINLKLRNIDILDPFIGPTPDEAVSLQMTPIMDTIPWLLKRFCCPSLTTDLTTEQFTCNRIYGLYDNKGDGDCGPVTCKFLEMHAHGMEYADLAALTDEVVTRIRKVYAMDTYAAFVEGENEF